MRSFSIFSEDRMNVHQNARLTPHSRAEPVRRVVVEEQAQGSGGRQHAKRRGARSRRAGVEYDAVGVIAPCISLYRGDVSIGV